MAVFGFDERTTHVGFADESSWNEPNLSFRSIACVSARVEHYCEIESRLYAARCQAGAKMAELKWSEPRTEKRGGKEHQRDTAYLMNAALYLAVEQKLRIDVVIWDKRDRESLEQQFDIREKPDEWHLQNMYRTLITFVINRWRSIEDASLHHWSFAIDQHEGLNFRMLQNHILRNVVPKNGRVAVDISNEKESPNYSLQLVDIFAGLGAYSHNHWSNYDLWIQQNKPNRSRIPAPQAHLRFPLLDFLHERCASNQLGVSLLEQKSGFGGRGFWTPYPSRTTHTVNFWCYTLN